MEPPQEHAAEMTISKRVWISLWIGAWCCLRAVAQPPDTTQLLHADFNSCSLPAGWQVRLQGDTVTPTWYVGLSQIPDAIGASIDGTCLFFIDGRVGDKAAPAHVLELVSPPFSRSGFTTVACRMDVHFKFGDSDVLEILATNGSEERLLARYDNYMTNYEPLGSGDFFRFRSDLAFLSWSEPTRLLIRYTSPAGSQGRYAGIDNIEVMGTGEGSFVLAQDFDGCSLPPGWTSERVSGSADWSFGRVPLGSSAFYQGHSMNGTCFAFFDDNAQGSSAAPTHIRLYSPWFSGSAFMEYELTFDAILRYSGYESFTVYLESDKGGRTVLFDSKGHVAGPFFPDYGHFSLSLSAYRSAQWRLVFEYSDGGAHGYWVGLDNVKVIGRGAAVDFCERALTLSTGMPCVPVENRYALYTGPTGGCAAKEEGSVWFRWVADVGGWVKLTTEADFNDVVGVFTGSCSNLSWVSCHRRDEHGFTGEVAYFQAQLGQPYFIRLSGERGLFGASRGSACVRIEAVNQPPMPPPNDKCTDARLLAPDAPCPPGTNRHADMSNWQPSHNRLARADVWYAFHAPTSAPAEVLTLDAQANFSHILTVYEGTCNSLKELATNPYGSPLRLPALTPGKLYYAQVAGVFATVEGDLCPVVRIEKAPLLTNDDCPTALPIALGAPCTVTTHVGATFSGYRPTCAPKVAGDVWFQFKAPAFGAVRLNTGAAFDHLVAVWEGSCADLKPVFCTARTRYCDEDVWVPNLNNGQTYYVQIAARAGTAAVDTGPICLTVSDGALPDAIKPLTVSANELCVGKDSVRLLLKVDGGRPPYVFLADTAGQVVRSGQPFGVVVRDARGCEAHAMGIAKACEQNICTGTLHFDLVEPSCFGASDGFIAGGVGGGKGPFFFEWSNGVFTANNGNLKAGTYTLLVSETTGCTYSATVTLQQPDSLTLRIDSLVQPSRGLSNGAVYLSISGGTPPYTYGWADANGTTLSTELLLQGVPAGTYTFSATDRHSCTQELVLTLTESVRLHETTSPDPLLQLFPNPAHTYVWLGLYATEQMPLEIRLFDAMGRLVFYRQAYLSEPEAWIKIPVHTLPPSTYWVALQTPKWFLSRRLVIER
jgi:hypothetical protein